MSRKDFECERDRWIGVWKKDPESLCISRKDMKHHAAVQALSSQMMAEYGCSLRFVSSSALRPYMQLSDKTPEKAAFKLKVFEMILKAIKDDRNPLTLVPFGERDYGLTEGVVRSFVRYAKTGNRRNMKATRRGVRLSLADVHLIDGFIKHVSSNGCSPECKRLADAINYRLHRFDLKAEA